MVMSMVMSTVMVMAVAMMGIAVVIWVIMREVSQWTLT